MNIFATSTLAVLLLKTTPIKISTAVLTNANIMMLDMFLPVAAALQGQLKCGDSGYRPRFVQLPSPRVLKSQNTDPNYVFDNAIPCGGNLHNNQVWDIDLTEDTTQIDALWFMKQEQAPEGSLQRSFWLSKKLQTSWDCR